MSRSTDRKRARSRRVVRSSDPWSRWLGAELLEDRRMLHVLTTGVGDGSLTVTVDGFGSFGSAIGFFENTGAIYDPIGPIGPASTTFQSGVAFRVGSAGGRQFLTSGDLLGSGGLLDPVTTGSPTSALSSFTSGGLSFQLTQTASTLLDTSNTQTGSILTQRYAIDNPTNAPISFEMVRYIDGDLFFDGTLVDGGGRLISAGREFLFETDAGGSGSTDTTFLGIDAVGGTLPTIGRFEVDSFAGLGLSIIEGTALDDTITGDQDGDGFVDAGQEYDVTLALRNVFTLAPGESVVYTTRTAFGSGNPEDIPVDPLIAFDADVMQFEGDSGLTAFVFSVSLTQDATSTFAIDYETADGTATAGADYQAQTGTLTFEVGGPTTQTITVNVVGEQLVESNETFFVRLSSGAGTADDVEAVGTILNDDISLSINDISILEGNSGTKDAVFTVSAAGEVNAPVRFGYTTVNGTASAGTDYLARGGQGTLPRGASSARITVPIVGDRLDEATETFFVALVGAENAIIDRALGTATILDDDPIPNLYVNDVQVTTTLAGTREAVFTVALDAPSGREVVVEYITADGAAIEDVDYTGQGGTLTFAPGVLTRSVSVPVFTHGDYTFNRHFFLRLMDPSHAEMADPQGTATIVYAAEPIGEMIIDNGDSGYTESGSWTQVTNTLAYQLDYGYHAPGNGAAVATWSFADIPNGSYQVFARWSWFVNRATNAPFTILDGTTPEGTVLVNQQVAPAGDHSNGISWQELGTFEIQSGNLNVQLGNNANGFVVADAIRIVSGGIGPQQPEMDVAGFASSIATGDHSPAFHDGTDFGTTPVLTDSLIHEFSVTNNGNADLHLTGSPRVTVTGAHAGDFWILSQPAATIAPTRHTTFELMFHPSQAGLRTAVVSIANDDDSEHPYTFSVHGMGGGGVQNLLVMDDSMPGFSQAGQWTASASSQSYNGQMLNSALGQDTDEAVWQFSGVAPGTYDVYATWVPATDRSTSARFSVSNNTNHSFVATVNQQQAPAIRMNATSWTNLGALDVNGGSLRVALTNNGKGVVVADAIMLVPAGQTLTDVPYAQNAALPQDVNRDGRVSPSDVLMVINNLLVQQAWAHATPQAAAASFTTGPFVPQQAAVAEGQVSANLVDVNADGRVSPVDVLMVINYYLSQQAAAASAGALAEPAVESPSALAAVAVDQAIAAEGPLTETAVSAYSLSAEFVPAGATAGGESASPRLLQAADVESLLSSESEEPSGDEDPFDPLLVALGD